MRGKALEDSDIQSSNETENEYDTNQVTENSVQQKEELPEGTPEWGVKLLEIMQRDFRSVTQHVSRIEKTSSDNTKSIKMMEQKLAKVERHNKSLSDENVQLKERLLELEYKQHQCNLLFEGVQDAAGESDVDCINKLRSVLAGLTGIGSFSPGSFVIDKCYRVDGAFKPTSNRQILCTLNWYHDVQTILKNWKLLPKGVYVNEDYPDKWIDRHKVLRPIFNTAKRTEALKAKTHLTRDKLVIDGKTFTVAPIANLTEVGNLVNVPGSCQCSDDEKIIFLRCHSVFSNLYPSQFSIDNVTYNCVEQRIQSAKAALFNDDQLHHHIMRETNPYKIKKLGSKGKNFSQVKWRRSSKQIALVAVGAKFKQNQLLRDILLSTSNKKIAESSTDTYWGTGLHLCDRNALDQWYWSGDGGLM